MRQLNYPHIPPDAFTHFCSRFSVACLSTMVALAGLARRVPRERAGGAARGDAQRHARAAERAARESARHHLQVRRRAGRAFRSGLPRDGPRRGRLRRADLDRRSHAADADHAVEAGADRGIHADDLRARPPLRRRGDDPDRALHDRHPEAGAAQRRRRRPARLQGREAPAAAADRERARRVQGGLASGGRRGSQRVGRVAVDQERRDADVQESQEGFHAVSRYRQPGQRVPTRARSCS